MLPLDTLERLAGTLLLYPYILTLLLLSGLLAGAALQNMRWVMAGQSSGLMGEDVLVQQLKLLSVQRKEEFLKY